MARVKLLEVEEMNVRQKELYDQFPSNLVKGLLLTENLTNGYAALGTAFRYMKLSPRIREFAIVRVAYLSNCKYELMQHRELAIMQGWSDADIEAIANNNDLNLNDKMKAILQFINECVKEVKVSDTIFEKVRKFIGDEEIAELTLLIGHYMMTARFLETLEIDLDDEPTSWENIKMQ